LISGEPALRAGAPGRAFQGRGQVMLGADSCTNYNEKAFSLFEKRPLTCIFVAGEGFEPSTSGL